MYGWVIDGLMIWVGYMWMVWVMADLFCGRFVVMGEL